jgi:hypothetical protein
LALNTKMRKYHVVHTPGTFGNFLAWLIDCYQNKEIKDSPFLGSGNSHGRTKTTTSWDIVMPQYMEKYMNNDVDGATLIGVTYPSKYFPYLLHASLDRTNTGQYGDSGVAYAEKDFYGFVKKHEALLEDGSVWMMEYLPRLKEHFNFECTEQNPTVPRLVLRNLLWLNMASESKHVWTTTNQRIKSADHLKIDMEDILDYSRLHSYLGDLFGHDLDFSGIHKTFLDRNNSLKEYRTAMGILDAVDNNKNIIIEKMSVVGECIVMWYLERKYFDISFYNLPFQFTTTGEILEYVAHYPTYMKNPNKYYQTHWRDFNNG